MSTENCEKAFLRFVIFEILVDFALTLQEKKNELSLTTRKKNKPVSSLSRDGLQKSFFDFVFARFDKISAFRLRQKERKRLCFYCENSN